MLKKTISYTDYNGVERTEDFYFNLSKAELTEMELGTVGSYSETVKKIIEANSTPELLQHFKSIILKAYGVKSLDGKKFIKNDEVRADFEQSEAYSVLFMELVTDDKAAADFINGLLPSDLVSEMKNDPQYKMLTAKVGK